MGLDQVTIDDALEAFEYDVEVTCSPHTHPVHPPPHTHTRTHARKS